MDLLPVVALTGGVVLLYAAIKNKNPLGVLKATLSGKDLATVAPIMGGGGPGAAGGQIPAKVDSIKVGGNATFAPGVAAGVGSQALGNKAP